eukprot:7441296-Alexandrium_andersonii.AAC.1
MPLALLTTEQAAESRLGRPKGLRTVEDPPMQSCRFCPTRAGALARSSPPHLSSGRGGRGRWAPLELLRRV